MALLLFVVPFAGSPAWGQPAQPSATEIYDRACEAVAARALPAYIVYTQYAAFMRRGHVRSQTDRVTVRLADGKTNRVALDEPRALARVEDRPLIFPTTTFGLVRRTAGEKPSAFEPGVPPAAGAPVIGRVSATARLYDATLAGTETLAGVRVYHLLMTPRFDPRRNRIRAMFVDAATFQPRRILIEYFAARGPVRSRPTVTVDYAPVDGTWVIAHAALDFVLRFGFFEYGGSAELRISGVAFPITEPNWLFDAAALAEHRKTPPPQTALPAGPAQ